MLHRPTPRGGGPACGFRISCALRLDAPRRRGEVCANETASIEPRAVDKRGLAPKYFSAASPEGQLRRAGRSCLIPSLLLPISLDRWTQWYGSYVGGRRDVVSCDRDTTGRVGSPRVSRRGAISVDADARVTRPHRGLRHELRWRPSSPKSGGSSRILQRRPTSASVCRPRSSDNLWP